MTLAALAPLAALPFFVRSLSVSETHGPKNETAPAPEPVVAR